MNETTPLESCSMGEKLFKKETQKQGNDATVSLNYFQIEPPNWPVP